MTSMTLATPSGDFGRGIAEHLVDLPVISGFPHSPSRRSRATGASGLVTRAALRGVHGGWPLACPDDAHGCPPRGGLAAVGAPLRLADLIAELRKAHKAHLRAIEDFGLDTPEVAMEVTKGAGARPTSSIEVLSSSSVIAAPAIPSWSECPPRSAPICLDCVER